MRKAASNPDSLPPATGMSCIIPRASEKKPLVDAVWLGGTIGSVQRKVRTGTNYLAPSLTGPQFQKKYLAKNHVTTTRISWHTPVDFPEHGIDSTNLTEEQMMEVAHCIFALLTKKYENAEETPGILLTQGTDSMEHMAAYLAFAIQNPSAGITLTGAQLKPSSPHTDAVDNVAFGLSIATSDCAEVGVAFGRKLWRGSGVTKREAVAAAETFVTPHLHHLAALIGESVQWFDNPVPRRRGPNGNMTIDERCSPPRLYQTLDGDVRILSASPYYATVAKDPTQKNVSMHQTRIFRDIMLGGPTDAAVIGGYAAGNIPQQLGDILRQISETIPIIVAPLASTQGVQEEIYEVSPKVSHPSLTFAEGVLPSTAALKFRWLRARANALRIAGKLKQDHINAWIRTRFALPIGREIPPGREGGAYIPATVVRDFVESADLFTEGLKSGKTHDILRVHESLLLGQRRKFWEKCARTMGMERSEALAWTLDRDRVNLPIEISGNEPKVRDKISEVVLDPANSHLGRLWSAPELIGENIVEGMSRICGLYQDQIVEFCNETGTKYETQKIMIPSRQNAS